MNMSQVAKALFNLKAECEAAKNEKAVVNGNKLNSILKKARAEMVAAGEEENAAHWMAWDIAKFYCASWTKANLK